MKTSKAAGVILIAIIFLLLCACARGGAEQTTGPSEQYTTTPATTGEAATENQTAAPAGETTTAAAGTAAPLTPLSPKADIVSLFNEAANRVKQTKPGYTFSSTAGADKKNITVSDNVPFHSFIASFAASFINSAKKEPVTVAKGENHNDFPVKGQPWASRLDPAALTGAVLNDNGMYYEIELQFKDEKLSALPAKNNNSAHGKAFTLLLDEDFRKEFGGFNTKFMGINIHVENQNFEPAYSGSSIRCKIDKAGNMLSAVYFLNTVSDVDMMVEVNSKDYLIGIKLEYSMTETYTFD